MVQKALNLPTLRNLIDRAANDPQRMRARKIEAKIIEKMPSRVWLSCTAVSRLIRSPDDRKIRARLDRLVRDGKIERKREQGSHGTVYLFRRPS
jgi:ribosomal protein L19E